MLKVHTKQLGNVAVVAVQGRIVNGETASLREAVDAQSRVNTVLLDLARVSTIDASGLGLMLELRTQIQSKGMRFKLTNVTKLVSRVLEVTKLDSVFEISYAVEQRPPMAHARTPRLMPFARCA